MPTYIDCLCCDTQDIPNQARGLCQHCYPLVPANRRDLYSLEDAKLKRQARLNGDGAQDSESGPDPVQQDPVSVSQTPDSSEPSGALEESGGNPLAGFEFVPCSNAQGKSAEVNIDTSGKFLRFGSRVVQDLGLTPGMHVHVYAKANGLALKILSSPDRLSFKLSRDGSAKQGPYSKITLSARRLVKRGWVRPSQRFEIRKQQDILFLDAIEESAN